VLLDDNQLRAGALQPKGLVPRFQEVGMNVSLLVSALALSALTGIAAFGVLRPSLDNLRFDGDGHLLARRESSLAAGESFQAPFDHAVGAGRGLLSGLWVSNCQFSRQIQD
jgi:hypothetical protein